jgi:hypothetical protein
MIPCPACQGSGSLDYQSPQCDLPATELAYAAAVLDLPRYAARLIQQALTEAMPSIWDRRAETFEWIAAEQPGQRVTNPMRHLAITERARVDAARCRIHAHLLRGGDATDPAIAADVDLILASEPDLRMAA